MRPCQRATEYAFVGCERQERVWLCRRKVRISGFCKVEMSAFLGAGRPDVNRLFVTSRCPERLEQLRQIPARTQFGRALAELDIEWIAAQSPQATGQESLPSGNVASLKMRPLRAANTQPLAETAVWGKRQQKPAGAVTI